MMSALYVYFFHDTPDIRNILYIVNQLKLQCDCTYFFTIFHQFGD